MTKKGCGGAAFNGFAGGLPNAKVVGGLAAGVVVAAAASPAGFAPKAPKRDEPLVAVEGGSCKRLRNNSHSYSINSLKLAKFV